MTAKVEDFMTQKVITIDASKSILVAAKVLRDQKIGSIVVTQRGKPVGILTDRDVITRAVAEELRLKKEKVGSIMSKPLVTTKPEASMFEVMKLMEKHSIRRIPVVKDDKIIGIITQSGVERAALMTPHLSSGIPEIYLAKGDKRSKQEKQ
jgi:CBS domain-containing protein